MTKDISIAIVVYRNYEDAKKAVLSLEKTASFALGKVIYIIDNSQPRTEKEHHDAEDMKQFLSQYEDTVYIQNRQNVGFARGQNQVLSQLDSNYHAIVNPDVILLEDSMSKIIQFMESEPDIGMVIPRIVDENGQLQWVYRHHPTVIDMFIRMFFPHSFIKRQAGHSMQNQNFDEPFQVPFGQGSFLVIRTELFKEMKGFDERFFLYMEDADFCRRVNERSSLYYYPGTAVFHRWEKGSHKNLKLFMIHVHSMMKYFHKWGL